MKKKYQSNFYHGIMFHHFHDNHKHLKSQGSINALQLKKMIKLIGPKNILDPKDFIQKLEMNKLKKNHVCMTFDDGLKSQIDVAEPILNKFKIKAFFFIYSSLISKKPDYLEVFRYFRTTEYKKIDLFYKDFFSYCDPKVANFLKKKEKKIKEIKKQISFYSVKDIKFRLVRDHYLSKKEYLKIMTKLMKKKKFKVKKIINKLFLSKSDIKTLLKKGHEIGLHSHTHPTNLARLNYNKQLNEYKQNKQILQKEIMGKYKSISSMSHPCGSYNLNTLKILKKLGLKLGFRQMMSKNLNFKKFKINQSNFEISREDHANILRNYKI